MARAGFSAMANLADAAAVVAGGPGFSAAPCRAEVRFALTEDQILGAKAVNALLA